MKTYTLDDLKVMTPEQRSTLYRNASNHLEAGGQAIVDLLNESGLPLRSGGMRLSDPVYLRMEEIIWSPAGRAAALEATNRGLPAMAGVDPLLQADLGDQYGPQDMGTVSAGSIVGGTDAASGIRRCRPREASGRLRCENGNEVETT